MHCMQQSSLMKCALHSKLYLHSPLKGYQIGIINIACKLHDTLILAGAACPKQTDSLLVDIMMKAMQMHTAQVILCYYSIMIIT